VWVSIGTVLAVVLKIGLHWRWIVSVARKHILPQPVAAPQSQPVLAPVAVEATQRRMDRRSFLVLMGGVTLSGALAVRSARKSVLAAAPAEDVDEGALLPQTQAVSQLATATAKPTLVVAESAEAVATAATVTVEALPTATPVPAAVPTATAVVQQCSYRCPFGRHCSYPGRCGRYHDGNGNRKCDLGECL
jgi:hypothetical protein